VLKDFLNYVLVYNSNLPIFGKSVFLVKSALHTLTSYETDIHKLRDCENKVTARIFVPKGDDKFVCFTLRTIYNNNNNNT
jgi:hypothetical protein